MAITISLDSSEKLDSSNSLCSDDDQGSGVHVSMPVEDSRGYYIDSDASVGSNRTRKQGSKYDSTTYRDGPRRSRSIYPRGPTSIGSNARGTRKEAASKPGRNLDIQVKEKACDAILRPDDQAKDITLHLEMNGAVDLSDELAHLSRLNILGHFKAGISFFESRLASHVDFFPVVAEYIDLLLEQGDSGKLAEFAHERLHDPLTTYSCHERSILKLTKGVANMRAKGSLLPALELAKKFLKLREDLGAGSDQYSEGEFSAQTQSKNTTSNHKGASSRLNLPIGLQIQGIDICLRIIKYAFDMSSYLENDRFRCLLNWSVSANSSIPKPRQASAGFSDRESRMRRHHNRTSANSMPLSSISDSEAVESEPWPRKSPTKISKFPHPGSWYGFLIQEGYFWESSRLLRSIITILGDGNGCYQFDGSFERVFGLRSLQESVKKFITGDDEVLSDEQPFFADFANATALIPFLNVQSNHQIHAIQNQFVKTAESMARKLFLSNQELINSRPYFYWLMVKGGLKTIAEKQAKPSILSTSSMSSRGLCQEGVDQRPYRSNKKDLTDSKPATDPSSWDNTLSTIEASAADIGDYGTASDALVIHINGLSNRETSLKKIQELASLSLDAMSDAVGYAICLVREARLITSHDSSNPDLMDQRTDLYLRFKDFDELYPSWFDHPQLQNLPGLVAFDIPLACWEKMCALNHLLLSMNRPAGAQLSLSSQYVVERHLSTKRYPSDLRFLSREPCNGCDYCDQEEKTVRFPQSHRISHTRRTRRVSPPGSQKPGNLKQIRTGSQSVALELLERDDLSLDTRDVLRPGSREATGDYEQIIKAKPSGKIGQNSRPTTRPKVTVNLIGVPGMSEKSFNVSMTLRDSFQDFKADLYQLFQDNQVVSPYLMELEGTYDIFHANGTRITDSNWEDVVHAGTSIGLCLVDLPRQEDAKDEQNYESSTPVGPDSGRFS